MALFCIFDHPNLPVVRVSVERRRTDVTRDGFRLRYMAPIAPDSEAHADSVISMLDDDLGRRTRGHGVYQAKYDEVRAAYGLLLAEAGPEPTDFWQESLRAGAIVLAVALTVTMAFVLPITVFMWLIISAVKRQNGLVAMAEASVVWSIVDWRPLIHKLIFYWRDGKWPR
jgi:hypothetical protein